MEKTAVPEEGAPATVQKGEKPVLREEDADLKNIVASPAFKKIMEGQEN